MLEFLLSWRSFSDVLPAMSMLLLFAIKVWCRLLGVPSWGWMDLSWFARPRNAHRSLMHVGVGKFCIAAYFVGSGLMPPGEMICPANSISVPISNFFLEIVMLAVWQRSNTVLTLECSSWSDDAKMRVSSTTFLAQGSPQTMTSDWQHHLFDDALRPIGALRYQNFPSGKRKVVMKELFCSSASWK